MNKSLIILMIFLSCSFISAQNKKPVSTEDFAGMNRIENMEISPTGNLIYFGQNPLRGNTALIIYNVKTGQYDTIARGKDAILSPSEKLLLFRITPDFDSLRSAKIKKLKKDKMPKDSLGIYFTDGDSIVKIALFDKFKTSVESGDFAAYTIEVTAKADTSDSTKAKKDPEKYKKLILISSASLSLFEAERVLDFGFSEDGSRLFFVNESPDTLKRKKLSFISTSDLSVTDVINDAGTIISPAFDKKGLNLAFYASNDTGNTALSNLYNFSISKNKLSVIIDSLNTGIPQGYSFTSNSTVRFSPESEKILFSVGYKPEAEVKDTIPDDEKVKLDVWNWKDKRLQTQQINDLEKDKKQTLTGVISPEGADMMVLENDTLYNFTIPKKSETGYGFILSKSDYEPLMSWEGFYFDIWSVNLSNGKMNPVARKIEGNASLSPDGEYIVYFNQWDSCWYSYSNEEMKTIKLNGKISQPFYNEENDVPDPAGAYGLAGWLKKDNRVVIYDRYDLWAVKADDPSDFINLTKGMGRNSSTQFRYLRTDRDLEYIDDGVILLSTMNENSKASGFYKLNLKDDYLQKLIMDDFRFSRLAKAKNSDKVLYTKESFEVYPDYYLTNTEFTKSERITNGFPNKDNYLWGTVKLVEWTNFSNQKLQGMLYLPENYDPSKKYPMVVYYYEKYADELHRFSIPAPSRSIINFSHYASNGYIVFVPDIVYKTGYPGASAYDCVVSGTKAMLERYPFIDGSKIGIQGQSWGGYQSAYLITQTDMFAAAMAGAPVANMTSAYGGIRWGSGLVRQFQYERQQSRIGATLWERRDLYIDNSPLFFLDRVTTPLLIMHNDQDDAVPWWQGIELFTGLRRLQKPVWMLTYNNDVHNLKEANWGNRIDLTIRMMQFFDHYLKGAPAPEWMEKGIPALKKGKITGY